MKFGLQNDSTNAYQMGWCAVGAGEEREERPARGREGAAGAGARREEGGAAGTEEAGGQHGGEREARRPARGER